MAGRLVYKIISCSSEDPSHPFANIYQDDESFWVTGSEVTKVELLIGLSSPSSIRTIVLQNRGACMIEILGGTTLDELENYHVLLPVHCLQTIQQVNRGINDTTEKHIRCNTTTGKVNRLRIILRTYQKSTFGLGMLQFASTRFTRRDSDLPASPPKDNSPVEQKPLPQSILPVKKEETICSDDEIMAKEEVEVKSKPKNSKPLKGVTIVISGIINPERSTIRDTACKLGASYSGVWNKKSTHLICSVFNQKKCAEAKKDGKMIVTPKWIYDCAKRKRKLEEDKYLLQEKRRAKKRSSRSPRRVNYQESDSDISDLSGSMSEGTPDDSWDSEAEEEAPRKKKSSIAEDDSWGIVQPEVKKVQKPKKVLLDDDMDEDNMIDEKDVSMEEGGAPLSDESEATEEMDSEVLKTIAKNEEGSSLDDLKGKECAAPGKQGPLRPFSDFMANMKFHMHISDKEEAHKIRKYIVAYAGILDKFLYTDTQYLITDGEWQASFNRAQDQMQTLKIVRPSWIQDCHKQMKVVDTFDHLVPDD